MSPLCHACKKNHSSQYFQTKKYITNFHDFWCVGMVSLLVSKENDNHAFHKCPDPR